MGGTFGPFWCAKNMNFGGESFEIRVLSRSIQETLGHIYKFHMKPNFYKKVSFQRTDII